MTLDSQTVRQKHKDFLFPCVANYYAEPVVITEAHGSTVKDLDGREYLDFFGGILTAGIGHSHPEFVKRLQDQLARLVHTSRSEEHTSELQSHHELVCRL